MTIITLRTPEESDIRRSQSMYEISRIDVRDIVSPGLLFDGSGFNYFFGFLKLVFLKWALRFLLICAIIYPVNALIYYFFDMNWKG